MILAATHNTIVESDNPYASQHIADKIIIVLSKYWLEGALESDSIGVDVEGIQYIVRTVRHDG